MRFEFDDHDLEELYCTETGAKNYPVPVVIGFFKRMQQIKAAPHENDLRANKSLRFEKLNGYDNKYSIRINDQWRIIFHTEKNGTCTVLKIEEISNHYSK